MNNPSQARHFASLEAYQTSDKSAIPSTGSSHRRRPTRPQPASVEDEADSLAREHGRPSPGIGSQQETPSRGEIDQYPVILEVHEYNPERRFVILNDTSADVTQSSKNTRVDDSITAKADLGRQHEPASQRTKPDDNVAQSTKTARVADEKTTKADATGRFEPAAQRPHPNDAAPKMTPRVDDDNHIGKTNAGRRHESTSKWTEPEPMRQRNRQYLPTLDTSGFYQHSPQHRRSRSSAMADAPRPEFHFPRHHRPYGDQLLTPDVISHGSLGGRDKAYQAYGQYTTSPTRQHHVEEAHRNRSDLHHRRTRTSSMTRRFDPGNFTSQPSKRLSGDWAAETDRRKDYILSSRAPTRDNSRSARRSVGEGPEHLSPSSSHTQSRSTSRPAKDANTYTYMQKPPLVFQDGTRAVVGGETDDDKVWRQISVNTSPHHPTYRGDRSPDVSPTAPRSSTFPLANKGRRRHEATPLPYPDDDDDELCDIGVGDGKWDSRSRAKAAMPSPAVVKCASQITPTIVEQPSGMKRPPSPPAESWRPPAWDPEKPEIISDRPAGTYRRYSEGRDKDGSGRLPECPRAEPMTGFMDWLTLSHTDFNICPTCYGAVFAQSKFRSHFLPILRPSDKAVACDFGSSPWYRIAWLLTLKHDQPDLRLLHRVASVEALSRDEPCPGNRKSTRNWLTVDDPYTRRPVTGFSVCYRCAMTVEALLPNLGGLFVRSMSPSHPTREVCALQFTPKRKQFVHYFDVFETTSDRAIPTKEGSKKDAVDVAGLAQELQQLSIGRACREDSPVHNGYWHTMLSVPEFTVCNACFDEVVEPRLAEGNSIARNFTQPQRLPAATCQLYSPRMRAVFHKACRLRDRGYLEAKVLERRAVEKVSSFAMTSRPTVSIIGKDGAPTGDTHPMPAVFTSPIRPDIVQKVHTGMAKNRRQPYAVSEKAGHQTSAESWGTGRAVARIPRVSGGGTHRAGQAAFGNMCRSGRMFAPTKIWRKWHAKLNQGHKRYATCSAVAASAVAPLLMARGHQIMTVAEVPLVVDSKLFEGASLARTAASIALLRAVGAGADLDKVKCSKKLRAGKGKLRGRRHRQRRGPLVVYSPEADGKELIKGFRNIPGVETCPVTALNLLQLAPGGHLGRFVIWSSAAFKALDEIYGSTTEPSALKRDFLLPSNVVSQADLNRLINSSEIQSSLNAPKGEAKTRRSAVQKKNPLRNKQVMLRLNPYAAVFAKEAANKEGAKDGAKKEGAKKEGAKKETPKKK
ncbi:hypothetical protein CP532_5990 [Ophiocordyceps camponoti-leonardi (nom. inval.)]|nr:hypothetical protein CP532_5990 [Ophiocordyceps camponoti-leonardi (nom. inval.)]